MVWLVLTTTLALFACAQLALAWHIRRKVPRLETLETLEVIAPDAPRVWPRLSIVVPARNEAHGIEGALTSKLGCGYPALEIVLVDDRSTDETGAIAARFAAVDPRLTVTRIDSLPEGWLGKVHAMSVGAAHATGDWILFSDADVHVAPGTLERIIAHAEAHAVDFVSVLPRFDSVSLVLDAISAGLLRMCALVGRTWQANDDDSSVGVGVGAFNMVRRSALTRTPGLQYIRMEMVDDIALGAMLKASGARTRIFAGRDAVHLVFAERLDVLVRSMEKGGSLMGFSLARTIAMTGAWFAVDLGVAVFGLMAGGWPRAMGALQLVALTAMHLVLANDFRAPLRGALLWPLGTLVSLALLFRSGALAWWRGAIVWRGTRYGRAEMEAGRRWIRGRVALPSAAAPSFAASDLPSTISRRESGS